VFKCVNCDFKDTEFKAEVAGSSQGAFTFRAKCPRCGSHMVNIEPGSKEHQLRVKVTR